MNAGAGPDTRIIGREAELAVGHEFLAAVEQGPAALVLEGLPGIGKTAIWTQLVRDAADAGVTVRACRCGESEVGWAFAGLGDLLEGIAEAHLAPLPAVQRSALSAALLLSDGDEGAPGERAVGVAVLSVLRALAATAPLVLAVDDVQWLDPSSRRVLAFALRRLDDARVGLLASCRTDGAGDPGEVGDLGLRGRRVLVGPVSIGTLQRIVRARSSQPLSRPTLTKLHRATGGNPMLCLEMARALERRGGREPGAGEPLPVPADFRVLVTERLRGLSPDAGQALLLSAASARPTLSALAAAAEEPARSGPAITELVRAGVLELEGERVRFTHPLMASIPYADLAPPDRRALHARLAATVTDPEERARHAALATDGRDAEVAAALDVAARRARARGSIDAAAELAELAVVRTPAGDVEGLLSRTVEAARYRFLLGDVARAKLVVTTGLEASAPGPARVPGLLLQATLASWEQGDATVGDLCGMAMREAGDDPLLLAMCHATLAETSPSGAQADLLHAERTVELLEGVAAPPSALLASSLTNVASHGCRLGRGLAVPMLERAAALQAEGDPVPVNERAGLALGMYLKVVDRFEESRSWLNRMWTCAVDEGDDSALPITLGHLAMLDCWEGAYASAVDLARQGREHAARMEVRAPMPHAAHVLALAHLGRLDEARALGEADLAADEALGYLGAVALHRRSLGFTELAAGNPAVAAEHLLGALSISAGLGIAEPAILRLHGDAVEALVAVRRLEEAERLTGGLESSAHASRLPWATALAGRCRGLLAAATADGATAVDRLREALADHEQLAMPFERARTALLLGGVLRRNGQRHDARMALEEALGVFVDLGTPVQVDLARAELGRIGGWAGRSATLTPVEEQVAALVSGGRTNRETADALFLSVRTVESHLGRIYRKLGVRSRTELAAQLGAGPAQG